MRQGKCDGGVRAEPVRIVIDANVFVSAAIGRGPSTRLIDVWLSGHARFEVVVCPRLIGHGSLTRRRNVALAAARTGERFSWPKTTALVGRTFGKAYSFQQQSVDSDKETGARH